MPLFNSRRRSSVSAAPRIDVPVVYGLAASPFLGSGLLDSASGSFSNYGLINPPLTTAVEGLAFHPNGDAVAIDTIAVSPELIVQRWNPSTGFGLRYPQPTTPIVGRPISYAFSRSGVRLAVASVAAPYLNVYAWSRTTGFGTKYSDPPSLPPAGGPVAFNAATTAIAIGFSRASSVPLFNVYTWSEQTGFLLTCNVPASPLLGPGLVTSLTFTPPSIPNNLSALLLGTTSPPYIYAYRFNSANAANAVGVRYLDPPVSLPDTVEDIQFHPSGQFVAVSTFNEIIVYRWSTSSGFLSTVFRADSVGFTPSSITNISWNSDGSVLLASNGQRISALGWNNSGGGFTSLSTTPSLSSFVQVAIASPPFTI